MKYQTIVIDPPWKYGKWGKPSNKLFKRYNEEFELPYPSMSLEDIKKLPVNDFVKLILSRRYKNEGETKLLTAEYVKAKAQQFLAEGDKE